MNSYLQKRQVRKLPERQRQPKASSTGFCAVRKDRHGMFLRKLGGVILQKTRLQRSACVRHIKQAVSREDRHGSRATKNVWHTFKRLQRDQARDIGTKWCASRHASQFSLGLVKNGTHVVTAISAILPHATLVWRERWPLAAA
jgi:hypothetical protein